MAKLPWWKHYPSDWLGSTRIMMLSWAQRGIYFHLLNIAWGSPGCQIPADKEVQYRLCAGARKEDVNKIVDNFFIPQGQGLINPRQHQEFCESVLKSDKARDSAKALWDKKKGNANASQTLYNPSSVSGDIPEAQKPDTRQRQGGASQRVLDIAHEKAHTAWTMFEHAIRKWALENCRLEIEDPIARKLFYEKKSDEWKASAGDMTNLRDPFIRKYIEIEINEYRSKKES